MNRVSEEVNRVIHASEHDCYEDAASLCLYAHGLLALARKACRASRLGDPAAPRMRAEGMRRLDMQIASTMAQVRLMDPAAAVGAQAALDKAERAATAGNLTQYAACALEAAEEIWRYYARRIGEITVADDLALEHLDTGMVVA